jgi:hypothetical protein
MTATLPHAVTFAGARYAAGVETTAVVSWLAFGGAYRYDIVARPRVRIGLRGEIERTNVQVALRNGRDDELTNSSVSTLPAGGLSVDLAVSERSSVTLSFVGLYVPDRTDQQFAYGGHYYDGRVDWRWRLAPHISAEAGYRAIDIRHLGQSDSGTLRLHGLLLGLVVDR